jgi:hypothetical protein
MSLIAKAMAKAGGGSYKTPTENVHELRNALAGLADRSHPPDKVRCCSSSAQPRGPLRVAHGFAAARRRSVPPAPKRVLRMGWSPSATATAYEGARRSVHRSGVEVCR